MNNTDLQIDKTTVKHLICTIEYGRPGPHLAT